MPRQARLLLISVLGLGALARMAGAAGPAPPAVGTPVSFLSCPIARDVGPEFDLCFFTEHNGVRYGLANPPDWGAPQLRHQVLVEGKVKDGPLVCGGLPLEGRASVMPEIDAGCSLIVPNDGSVKGAVGGVFNSGTPEQKAWAQALATQAETDPRATVIPAIQNPPAPPPPKPPFTEQQLTISYPFDSDRGPSVEMVALLRLAEYARVSRAQHIAIVGYTATSRLEAGRELVESPTLAQRRAMKIATILEGVGVPRETLDVRWESTPIAGDGIDDWMDRKVEVLLTP
jgi:outer membrane protein OmpA-like peptidoglycan-associated protein